MPQVLLVSSDSEDAEKFSSCDDYILRFVFAEALLKKASVSTTITDLMRECDAVVVDVNADLGMLRVLQVSAYALDIPVIGFVSTEGIPEALRENLVAVFKTRQEALTSLRLLLSVMGSAGPDYAEAVATIQAAGI
jgi:hypothetical protein